MAEEEEGAPVWAGLGSGLKVWHAKGFRVCKVDLATYS